MLLSAVLGSDNTVFTIASLAGEQLSCYMPLLQRNTAKGNKVKTETQTSPTESGLTPEGSEDTYPCCRGVALSFLSVRCGALAGPSQSPESTMLFTGPCTIAAWEAPHLLKAAWGGILDFRLGSAFIQVEALSLSLSRLLGMVSTIESISQGTLLRSV